MTAVGPIEKLTIPVPEEGGVVVLRGRNGSGKSYALAGVEALARPAVRKNLRPNDEASNGRVKGLGVTLTLGRANRASGELACAALDSACDPSFLVDPGIKDPEAADRKRLETLVRLLGIKLTAADWAGMFNGQAAELAELIDLGALAGDDPIQSADRIRRRLHDLALKQERLATSADQEAEAVRLTAADVDLTKESDEAVLRKWHERATELVVVARQEREAAAKARQRAEQARQRLAQASRDYSGPSVEAALERVAVATQRGNEARDALHKVELLMAQANQALESARAEWSAAQEEHKAAVRHDEMTAGWRADLEASVPECATDDQFAELEAVKSRCQQALELGARVRAAKRAMADAERLKAVAAQQAERAEKLRELARSTDTILERAMERCAGAGRVKVHDGRLCVHSSRRGGLEPVSELSHGERWALALDLAASGIGQHGLLTVEQEAWESLDPYNREFVAGLARDRGLVIVTAEADAGELRAEEFET